MTAPALRPGVLPLEIWDLPLRGRPLYRRLGSAAAAAGATDAELADALCEALALLPGRAPPFELAWVGGGLAERPGLREHARRQSPVPLHFAPEPTFAALAGARAEAGAGLLLDLGQTALKAAALGGARAVLPRDPDRLPLRLVEAGPASADEARAGRAALAEWAAEGALAVLTPELAPTLILALPCALEAGVPGPCSYAGLAGDAGFGERVLAALRARLPAGHRWLGPVRLRLFNDAALVAHGARAALPGRAGLALTVGFGPGAAWFGRAG